MIPEQKELIEQAAEKWVDAPAPYSISRDKMLYRMEKMAEELIDHPSDFNLVSTESFSKEPVSALLVSALKYCNPEQIIALRNALNERTERMFSREEVVELCEGYQKSLKYWEENDILPSTFEYWLICELNNRDQKLKK